MPDTHGLYRVRRDGDGRRRSSNGDRSGRGNPPGERHKRWKHPLQQASRIAFKEKVQQANIEADDSEEDGRDVERVTGKRRDMRLKRSRKEDA